jgi:hypothetical protein
MGAKGGWGGARPGSGRKPKPARERQRHPVTAKLTDDELRELREAAGDEPLGRILRRIVLRFLARRRKRG